MNGNLKMSSERLSFEPFKSLDGVLTGAPIRVFPEGTFYRGDRKLTVTRDRLQEFAANIKAGLPRFDIPMTIEHMDEVGRYGTVKDLEYFEDGPQGPGLYATQYELTPAGRTLLEQEKFIGLSGEAMWTLFKGVKYQDPNTGNYHDNVLVGLTLTNKPFFGKEVNLYSAEADTYRSFTTDERKKLAKSGAAMPGGRYPIANAGDLRNAIHAIGRGKGSHAAIKAHIRKRAKALGLEGSLPSDWDDPNDNDADDMTAMEKCAACGQMNRVDSYKCSNCGAPLDNDGDADQNSAADAAKEQMSMSEEKQAPPPAPEPEKFTISAEEFKALQTKAGEVEKLHILMAELKHTGRVKDLTAHVKETFTSLPVKAEELAEKFAALEAADPKLFEYFDGLLATLERQVATGDLFGQIATGLPGGNAPETFSDLIDKVLTEKFNGDMSKYAEAMKVARTQNPALAAKYETTYSQRPSKTQARA